MPSLPQHKCTDFGCGAFVPAGSARCGKHQRAYVRPEREKTADRGYDEVWRRKRVEALQRDQFTCRDCGWQPEAVSACLAVGLEILPDQTEGILGDLRRAKALGLRRLDVDHIIPHRGDDALRLALSNLQTLCNVCHSRKTASEDGGFGNARKANQTH